MPYRDPDKARASALERGRRYRAKKHAERYGPDAPNMSGRHGNHARGENNARWNNGRYRTSQGYIGIAVPEGHHLRQAHGYAYEHQLVMERKLGRRLEPGEHVHHMNHVRDDNRPENLEVVSIEEHALLHTHDRPRDGHGRLTTRELPPPKRDPKTGRMLGGARPGTNIEDLPPQLRVREYPEEALQR